MNKVSQILIGIFLFLLTITAQAQNAPSDYIYGKCRNSIASAPNGDSNSSLTFERKNGLLERDIEMREELNMFTDLEENNIIDYLIANGCDIYLFLGVIANMDIKEKESRYN